MSLNTTTTMIIIYECFHRIGLVSIIHPYYTQTQWSWWWGRQKRTYRFQLSDCNSLVYSWERQVSESTIRRGGQLTRVRWWPTWVHRAVQAWYLKMSRRCWVTFWLFLEGLYTICSTLENPVSVGGTKMSTVKYWGRSLDASVLWLMA